MKIRDFIPCPDEIIQKHGVYAAMIYGRVYRFSQKDGYCYAAHDTIAEWLNIARSTVQKYIKLLVSEGYIEDLSEGVRNRPHRYRPNKSFNFYVSFGARETGTDDLDGNRETGTTDRESGTGARETVSTDRETGMNKELNKEFKKEKEEIVVSPPLQKAKQAWGYVLDQLQYDMAKATFDTWMKNTECVAFEDGTFIIGVENAYARDWIESRLTSTVTGLLAGAMDQNVEVRFVVWQEHREAVPV